MNQDQSHKPQTNQTVKVLIIEDDSKLAGYMEFLLKQEGIACAVVSSLKEARKELAAYPYDILLLDLGLPDGDGLEFLEELRKWNENPVIVVSARDQDQQKVRALDLGADDYLTKPFSPTELMARIRVALRHLARYQSGSKDAKVKIGDLEMDFLGHTVHLKKEPVHLTPLEYRLLQILMQHPGKVLTTRFLLDHLYGSASTSDTSALRQVMTGLRRKIEPSAIRPRYIHTETGIGYRMADE